MRHQKSGRKFSRVKKVRVALVRSLARSLIIKERITTTESKAKEIRPYVEKLVTKAKIDTLNNRRLVIENFGQDKTVLVKLFGELGPRFQTRPGGYLRIAKLGRRVSDGSPMAIIEFV
ncbi:MAG: 50S ribosomal protein L17 [Candidatus Vogelbacteria bacterium CG10_big_fil_rev_8_21_14_0_10_49_38]|uniref:Large ribosomal subunit protein bL17 n=1 Tax=Candidatus Vogelbacteria bacterium CG10_big_fil_rev_8_21_14_0_10_49_38 TaxID=1975043 RepID=A0A2H0RIK9_9BACT|nr:MAG: 50S ribosomal protein L17 [bacterium CG10_49_38]PIR45864.1 MAG: 50S ribosomal protein L17 [Candidatus Vogelbacteria bacterium CG10_big_fil_rev_8_21_14_0_10_49_38]